VLTAGTLIIKVLRRDEFQQASQWVLVADLTDGMVIVVRDSAWTLRRSTK